MQRESRAARIPRAGTSLGTIKGLSRLRLLEECRWPGGNPRRGGSRRRKRPPYSPAAAQIGYRLVLVTSLASSLRAQFARAARRPPVYRRQKANGPAGFPRGRGQMLIQPLDLNICETNESPTAPMPNRSSMSPCAFQISASRPASSPRAVPYFAQTAKETSVRRNTPNSPRTLRSEFEMVASGHGSVSPNVLWAGGVLGSSEATSQVRSRFIS